MKNNKIIFTGGSGRFGSVLKKNKTKYKVFFPTKKMGTFPKNEFRFPPFEMA